ncbi:MAG: DHH family phosphoesterase [Bacilli bacterium]|nr:DHH family phosphoesterase [Bacilli bacterium]
MGKKIKHIQIFAFIIILLQFLLIAAFAVLYFSNLFDIRRFVRPDYAIIGSIALVAFDCIFVWIVSVQISSLRRRTDLHAAEVIGSDVQEAYNFAMIGLAVTDDNDTVLWTNDLFKTRHIDIIDSNILDWSPDLKQLKEPSNANGDAICKISYNSRNYEVKYLIQAGLWIFKDTTDYEETFKKNEEQAPVVGVLMIDNYDDVVRGDDDFNDIATRVKNVIFNYCKEYGVLLRRIKDDHYSMLCNFESYSKMQKDHFSIIDKAREVCSGLDIPLTLSIGIARNFPDVIKLNDLANEALDIAMSRGGDQVVVSVFGQEMEFYGGKTEAQEKRNRVKVRVLADSLISLIKTAQDVLVMGHTMMDMDAFGACLGIKTICDNLKKPCRVVVDIKATEYKTRGALTASFSKEELDQLIVTPKEAEGLLKTNTLMVVVDVHTSNMVMAPNLLDKSSKIVVIDHHRRAEDYIESPVFNHIDPAASSACEIISEFIKFSSLNPRIIIQPIYATIMLSGIFLDTSYFKSKSTGLRTFEACTILKEFGADNSLADDFLKDDYEEYKVVTDIVSKLEHPAYGVAVAVGKDDEILDNATIAKAANRCLTFKGVHASFVIGKIGQRDIRISGRSDGSINVQLLLEKMGGGGHFSSAAGTFEKTTIKNIKDTLYGVLDQYLAEATADAKSRKNLNEEA